MVNIKTFPKVFAVVLATSVVSISCSRDSVSESNDEKNQQQSLVEKSVVTTSSSSCTYSCTAGFEVIEGNCSNIGGGGSVALDASTQNFGSLLTVSNFSQGVLYSLKKNRTQLTNNKTFTVQNAGGRVMVRVVGKTTSNNYLTLVTAKELPSSTGQITIRVCNVNALSHVKDIYFQLYALENSWGTVIYQ